MFRVERKYICRLFETAAGRNVDDSIEYVDDCNALLIEIILAEIVLCNCIFCNTQCM